MKTQWREIKIGKIHLLCIGINSYPSCPSNEQLNFCKNDAELIYESYSKYSCETKVILTDNEATKTKILCSISDIISRARDEDYIIFSFAGHGATKNIDDAKADNSFICPHDFNVSHAEDTGINLKDLREKFNSMKSKNILLLLDSCHSGSVLRRSLSDSGFRDIEMKDLFELITPGKGYGIITACNSNEFAAEDSELKHGIFTHSLVETLKSDEISKLWEFEIVKNKLTEKIKTKTNNSQTPQFKLEGENFLIPSIPMGLISKPLEELKLDLSAIPQKTEGRFAREDFSKLITLIQENKDVYVSLMIEKNLERIYPLIEREVSSNLQTHDAKTVSECYSSCRNSFLPILEIFRNLAKFERFEILNSNFDKVVSLCNISNEKSGSTVILEIPITLIAELAMTIIYESKTNHINNLSFLFTPVNHYNWFLKTPLIFNSKLWHPEIFYRDTKRFFEFLSKTLFDNNKQQIKEFGKTMFIIDSLSKKDEKFYTYPIYRYSEFDFYDFICNLKNNKYNDVLNVFGVTILKFLELAIKRQEEIEKWHDILIYGDLYNIKEELKIFYEQLKTSKT